MRIAVDAGVKTALERFEAPAALGFGQVMAPVMYRAEYRDGRWGGGELLPYGNIALDPAAKVLHYAQVIFEGLKAYRVRQDRAEIFRPEMNARRLNGSAGRMLMPALPESQFLEGLYAMVAHCEPLIPRAPGRSLYLRPLMFGTQPALGLAPSDSYTFLVIASPSEAVASGSLRVIVEREGTRAARGGTGNVKVSGNYGASLHSTMRARELGFTQPLWLDAAEHRYIEELSIMNFFAVVDGDIHTPALSGTILPGVTRDSVIALARARGRTVHERPIEVDELLRLIESARCTEAFACGTAVIIAPIDAIGEADGRVREIPSPAESVALELRRELLDIQEGRARDPFGWMRPVPEAYYPA